MRRHVLVLLGFLAVVGLVAGPVLGQPEGPVRGPRPGAEAERAKAAFEKLVKELDLTADQQTQVRTMFDAFQQSMMNFQKEHAEEIKTLMQKLSDARQSGDEKAAKEAREALGKLMEGRREAHENLLKQLGGVLNEKQMVKVKELLAGPMGGPPRPGAGLMGILARLDLSEEQKGKVKEIQEAVRADIEKAQEPRERMKIIEAAAEKVKAILTPEQKAKFEELQKAMGPGGPRNPAGRMFEALNLNEDQKKRVDEIMKGAIEKAEKAEAPEAKRQALQDGFKEITEKVLTPEQRKQWEELRAKGPGAGPPPPKEGVKTP